MFSSPRPILFSTELECPPFKEVAISSRDAARALYNKMFEPGSGFRYENIDLQASEPLLSTRRGDDGRSICQIASHTIRLEELNPEMPVDGFVDVVKTVLNALKGYWHLFMIQKCKVQCLAQPNVTRNPLGILANRIGNIGDKIMPFGRPPTFFGVRFRFQPWSPDEDADSDVADEKATENEASSSASVSGAGEQDPDTESPDNHAGIEEARGFVT